MSLSLGRVAYDLWISIAASAAVTLMVLAGGLALETVPSDSAVVGLAPSTEGEQALLMCREDRFGHRCIPEDS
jgi:hypothetical protein